METKDVIEVGSKHLLTLSGHVFDLLQITKPISPDAALNLMKVVSKLSPMLGNLIEFNTVEFLNDQEDFRDVGRWKRQDPGFPDTIFEGCSPPAGFEIKAWFPLATEITARFKDSQNHFQDDRTHVCMLAWLPDQLFFGRPYIMDVCVFSGASAAAARDNKYHNPPDYLVLEPEDTTARTRNLQQTNTNGYKFQGTPQQFKEAQALVQSWGEEGRKYKPTPEYQTLLRKLIARYPYRLDTNFAKMDRIDHEGIEEFKKRVCGTKVHGLTVSEWASLLCADDDASLRRELKERFTIIEGDAETLLL